MNKGYNLAYCRVSSLDQNEERQIKALEKYNIDKFYIDKASGKDRNRPKLKEILEFARKGDTIYISELSRLGRSVIDLLEIIQELQERGINLISNKESIDISTGTGKLMITMLGAIAEYERTLILERQREGIKAAQARGVYKGRQKVTVDKEQFEALLKQYNSREINKVKFAAALNISRPTLDRLLREEKDKNNEL